MRSIQKAALPRPRAALSALSCASITLLAACGGGSGSNPAAAAGGASQSSGAATKLHGTVAVGAPITNGKLRILDANGAVVASDVAIDANGSYADVDLTGPAPYRIEACGYAAANYLCVYSLASAGGTANVTPLTTATVLLAAGQAPDSLMSGNASALTTASIDAAQTQLRSSLSNVLASAGVTSTLDFVTADLTAGSRTGYDGVLDAIGVSVGSDANAFVQITPRLGTGNLYLEHGLTSGSVTSAASASSLQLSGLETLFQNMSQSLASASACAASATGIARSLASTVQMSLGDGDPTQGVAPVASALCSFFGSGDDGNTAIWGWKFMSPTLGRCDLSGAAPVCGVSFVLQSPEGDVRPVGNGMAVTKEAGAWKFKGDLIPAQIQASAKAQRTRRIDTATPNFQYNRALAFEVAAISGLACAKVSQRDAAGAPTTIAYYKRHPGAMNQTRLSLWTPDGMTWGASTDPLVGATRGADDTWIALPEGAEGDAVIRNFYRGGRVVNVALFADTACATPFAVSGRSDFDVEVDGVPPVWSAMPNLPWPELDAGSQAAVRALSLDGGASVSLATAWTFARGPLGIKGATMCGSRDACGQGGTGRLGEGDLRASATSATLALHNRGNALRADDDKTFALYGASGDGVDLQSNYSSCPASAASEACH